MEWLQTAVGWIDALLENQTLQTLGLFVVLWSLGRLEAAQERTEEKINKLLREEQNNPCGDFQSRLRRAYAAGADNGAAGQHQRGRDDE